MKRRFFGWGPAALWAAVLFLLSESSGLGIELVSGADKWVHVGLFTILGLSLAWGKGRTESGVSLLLFLFLGMGYGALDEWHQSFVPGRDASVGDWVADSAGVILGLVLFSSVSSRFWEKGRSPGENLTTTDSIQP